MHDILEMWCSQQFYSLPAGFLANQISPFLRKHAGRIHCIETELWSDSLRLAGRCDLIAEWDGCISVIDLKTSKKPKKEDWKLGYLFQACFYCVGVWQRHRVKAAQVVVIIANDQGKPQCFVRKARPYYQGLLEPRKKFDEMLYRSKALEWEGGPQVGSQSSPA